MGERYAVSNGSLHDFGYITRLSGNGSVRTFFGYGDAVSGDKAAARHRSSYVYRDALAIANWLNQRARNYSNIDLTLLCG